MLQQPIENNTLFSFSLNQILIFNFSQKVTCVFIAPTFYLLNPLKVFNKI